MASVLDVKGLRRIGRDALDQLARAARTLRLKPGSAVFGPGQPCAHFLVVIAGSVRVATVTDGGRELVLYRVGPGQSCVLTTSCLMTGKPYAAEGTCETAVEALAIPKPLFDDLLATSAPFRSFVFGSFGERLQVLIALVQEVAERHVDRRLARFLSENAAGGVIRMTHQAVASELGTAREVVSRLLKDFEQQGFVRLERGRIAIADRAGLAAYSDGR